VVELPQDNDQRRTLVLFIITLRTLLRENLLVLYLHVGSAYRPTRRSVKKKKILKNFDWES
jgi:hypothetical protein